MQWSWLTQSTDICLVRITSPQRADSDRASFLKSSGVPRWGSKPNSVKRLSTTGSARALFSSRFNRTTTGAGRPAGPRRPWNAKTSALVTPLSARVGTSGSSGERACDPIASVLTLPLLMMDRPEARSRNIAGTCPPMRSCMAGAAPRYGMCVMNVPVRFLNSSMARWCIAHFARIRFDVGEKVLEVLRRKAGVNDQCQRELADGADVGKILFRTEGKLLEQVLVERQHRVVRGHHGVSVRSGAGYQFGADIGRGAWPVVHYDLLAQTHSHAFSERACQVVSATPCWVRHHPLDDLVRVLSLRLGKGAGCQGYGGNGMKNEGTATHGFLLYVWAVRTGHPAESEGVGNSFKAASMPSRHCCSSLTCSKSSSAKRARKSDSRSRPASAMALLQWA